MFVRDIVERPTTKPTEPSAAPQPPRPRGGAAGGFPLAAHRSLRGGTSGSAFARARKDAATRQVGGLAVGEGRIVESVPSVLPVSVPGVDAGASAEPELSLSEAERVRREVDAENRQRVEGMTDVEREQAASELRERFGVGVVELMRKRRAAREGTSTGASAGAPPASSSASTSTLPATGSPRVASEPVPQLPVPVHYRTTADLNDAQKIIASVDEENSEKVSGMSAEEHEAEMRDLEERFGATLLAKVKARAQRKQQQQQQQGGRQIRTEPEASGQQPVAAAASPKSARAEKREVHFDIEEATPAGLKKYFPSVPIEDAKLQWMQDGSVLPGSAPPSALSSDPNEPRFDLTGAPLTPETAAALPTHLGLHHHGDQPDLAGYTLAEIVHLCYSTVASQRITMMGVLGRIVTRYMTAASAAAPGTGGLDPWIKTCSEKNVVGKGVDVACGVLGGHIRSIGVLVAAVDLLFNALGGPMWQWMDEDVDANAQAVPFHPEPTREGEPTGVASVPFPDLAPRLSEVLALDPGALPPTTLAQLLRILQRAALAAPEGAEAVVPLLPVVLKAHVLRAPWPLDPARPPSRAALRLVREVVTSSRVAAEALGAQNAFAPLLKFAAGEISQDPLPQALLLEVLELFRYLARYGLQAAVATSARDIWQPLGIWVAQQLLADAGSTSSDVVCAYFELLSMWIVCAVDPHRTTPEHDLTWAQITALGWMDELLAAAKVLVPHRRWRELSTVLSALAEYVAGAAINGERKGEAEKAHVFSALQAMDLIGALPPGAEAMPGPAAQEDLNSALAQVFRLHNLLAPAQLLVSPELERLVWWVMATARTSRTDVSLRHAVLAAARPAGVLDVAQWAAGAFDLVLACVPGDEPLALSLVDDLLRTEWTTAAIDEARDHADKLQAPRSALDIVAAISAVGHKDGLQILRPLLHHAVLPDIENVLAPTRPAHLYLKASGTLRPRSAPSAPSRGPGLPLASDWVYCALDELLSSGTSSAFALAPSDWDASESELTRATLAFARIQADIARAPPASLVVLNAMKVFMLEHGQQDAPNTEQDVFRDAGVQTSLKVLLDSISGAETSSGDEDEPMETDNAETTPPPVPASPLEAAATQFLTPGVPFFQFYTDLLALYESVSFGDALFARVLLPPLAMNYAPDYRKLFWAEQPGALRSIRTPAANVPLECSGDLGVFFAPLESDKDVLLGQARALGGHAPAVREDASQFLFDVAVHHLAGLFWRGTDTERGSVRVQILVTMLSSAGPAVLRHIVRRDLDRRGGVAHEVDAVEVARRVKIVGELTGPRGEQRFAAADLEAA